MSYAYRYDLQSSLQKERSEKTGSIQAPVAEGSLGEAAWEAEGTGGWKRAVGRGR